MYIIIPSIACNTYYQWVTLNFIFMVNLAIFDFDFGTYELAFL